MPPIILKQTHLRMEGAVCLAKVRAMKNFLFVISFDISSTSVNLVRVCDDIGMGASFKFSQNRV